MAIYKQQVLGLIAAASMLAIDQFLKTWAHSTVEMHGIISVAPVLNIVASHNSGVSFGLAENAAPLLLIVVPLALSAILLLWILRVRSWNASLGIGAALGGALGNVTDRVLYGAVRDYIDVYWGTLHWPAFNLADAAIVAGLALAVLTDDRSDQNGRHR